MQVRVCVRVCVCLGMDRDEGAGGSPEGLKRRTFTEEGRKKKGNGRTQYRISTTLLKRAHTGLAAHTSRARMHAQTHDLTHTHGSDCSANVAHTCLDFCPSPRRLQSKHFSDIRTRP